MIDATPILILAAGLLVFTLVAVLPEYVRKRGGLVGLPWVQKRPQILSHVIPGKLATITKTLSFENRLVRYFVVNAHCHGEFDFMQGDLEATNCIDRTLYVDRNFVYDEEQNLLRQNLKKSEAQNRQLMQRINDIERNIDEIVDKRVQQGIDAKKASQTQVKKL